MKNLALAIAALALLVPAHAHAGRKKKAAEEAAARQEAEQQAALARMKPTILVEVDFDEDGVIDVKNYYAQRGGGRVLVKKETDLNLDGAVDVITEYDQDGEMSRELFDGDFDGLYDWVDTYKNGQRVKAEIDTDYNGRWDVFNTYANGKVVKKERDTDGDEVVDFWETFDADGNRTSASTDTTESAITDDPGADDAPAPPGDDPTALPDR